MQKEILTSNCFYYVTVNTQLALYSRFKYRSVIEKLIDGATTEVSESLNPSTGETFPACSLISYQNTMYERAPQTQTVHFSGDTGSNLSSVTQRAD